MSSSKPTDFAEPIDHNHGITQHNMDHEVRESKPADNALCAPDMGAPALPGLGDYAKQLHAPTITDDGTVASGAPASPGLGDMPLPTRPSKLTTIATWLTIIALGVAFGLCVGIAYGVSNHYQYLVHGLHALDPSFLANDWFTCQTRAHHITFTPLIVGMARLGSLPIVFALANITAAIVVVACLFALARHWFDRPIAVTALAVFLLVIVPRPYMGLTNLINMIFQPATVGAVGLFAGLTLIAVGRHRAAGLILGIAALFHINYMVWAVAIVGLLILMQGRQLKIRWALWLIAPLGLAVFFHLPFALESRTAEQQAAAAAAQWILHDLYMPYHSRPLTWEGERVLRFIAVIAMAILACLIAPPQNVSKHARHIVAIVSAIVVGGITCNAILASDLIALLFPWRMAPFLVTIAVLLTAGAVVRMFHHHTTHARIVALLLIGTTFGLHLAGVSAYGLRSWSTVVIVGLCYRWLTAGDDVRLANGVIVVTALAAICFSGIGKLQLALCIGAVGATSLAVLSQLRLKRRGDWAIPRFARAALPVGALAFILAFTFRAGVQRKDHFGPQPDEPDRALFEWCRSTPTGTRFVIPPDLNAFRVQTGRAIVIDWKCMPILPADTLRWYERLVDVAGIEFTSMEQCFASYRTLDANRAEALAENYQPDYIVVDARQHTGDLSRLPLAWSNDDWRVYRNVPTVVAQGDSDAN